MGKLHACVVETENSKLQDLQIFSRHAGSWPRICFRSIDDRDEVADYTRYSSITGRAEDA